MMYRPIWLSRSTNPSACQTMNKEEIMNEKTKYRLIDEASNTWMCQECGFMASFEADGPFENGWNVCPHCGDAILRPDEDCGDVSL